MLVSGLAEMAPLNMPDIFVTDETSQMLVSGLAEMAPLNMPDISVTAEKSGVSVAGIVRFEVLENAPDIEVHFPVPH